MIAYTHLKGVTPLLCERSDERLNEIEPFCGGPRSAPTGLGKDVSVLLANFWADTRSARKKWPCKSRPHAYPVWGILKGCPRRCLSLIFMRYGACSGCCMEGRVSVASPKRHHAHDTHDTNRLHSLPALVEALDTFRTFAAFFRERNAYALLPPELSSSSPRGVVSDGPAVL